MLIPYIFDYFWVCFTYLALAPLPRGSRAGFAAKETDVWTDPAVKNRGYDSRCGSCIGKKSTHMRDRTESSRKGAKNAKEQAGDDILKENRNMRNEHSIRLEIWENTLYGLRSTVQMNE